MQPGSSTAKVAPDLQIHANLLHRWVRERAASKNTRMAKDDAAAASVLAQENKRLQREQRTAVHRGREAA